MIDLHVHTTASDGEYSPSKIIQLAKKEGIDTIAITDHDTVGGIKEALEAGKKYGVEVIPGIEISAKFSGGKMHILGFYVDIEDNQFIKTIENFQKIRDERNDRFILEFQKNGIDMTMKDISKYSKGHSFGKPHMARVLLDKGYVNTMEEAFDNYFNKEPYKSIKRKPIYKEDAIKILKNNGAIVVIAHPITLKLKGKKLEEEIKYLKSIGLDGIECFNNIHSKEEIDELLDIAIRNDLLITAGSDFHGPSVKPGVILGKGKNNNIITDIPIVDNIKVLKKTKSN